MASRASAIERQLYQDLLDGKSVKDLKRDYQVQYGINARQFNSIHRVLQGKIGSRVECHKRQVQELSERITDLEKAIKKLQGRLKDTFPACPIKYGAKTPRQQIEWEIHQKKRKLESKLRKLEKLKARSPRVIFGGRKLFNAQFNLEANRYENHDDWLNDWQRTRTSQFTYVGSKDEPAACLSCQLTVEGRIKLQVPLFLQDQFGAYVEASGVSFAYGQEYINAAERSQNLLPRTKTTGASHFGRYTSSGKM